MPIYQTNNISDNLKIAIWKITETEDELTNELVLVGFELNSIYKTKNKQRLKQWLATRLLLNDFFKDVKVIYDSLGKPSLDNGWNISISHSNDFVAINLNKDDDCGIDIEKITPKIERIKHKFLNNIDLENVISLEHLIIYWGAKEALYKYYGKKEVLFIENLFINNFNKSNNKFNGKIKMADFQKEIPMMWEKVEDFVMVYTL